MYSVSHAGHFTALVVIGRRERPGADLLLPMLSEGTRRFGRTPGNGPKVADRRGRPRVWRM